MDQSVKENELHSVASLGAHVDPADWSEIKSGWTIILGCALGIASGIIAIPGAAILIFMKGFEQDFGWSRIEVSFAHTILFAVLMLTAPLVGFICDRKLARSAVLFSQIMIGCWFLAFSRIGGDITTFLILFGVMAVLGAGASTVSFARIISANFSRSRGLALGLALTGTGLSNVFLSLLLVPYVAIYGWRSGFIILGVMTLIAAPVVYLLLRKANDAAGSANDTQADTEISGTTFTQALATPAFWILAATFFLTALGTGGMAVHFVAMVTDAGAPLALAAIISSSLGGSLVVMRVLSGWLIDRYRATTVTAIMLVLATACLLSFAAFRGEFAIAGALAYGLSYGAELDIVGYLTARLFGMRAYGRIYGVLYAAIMSGTALSPIGYGLAFRAFGHYTVALLGAAVLLACATVLLLLLPRFTKAL